MGLYTDLNECNQLKLNMQYSKLSFIKSHQLTILKNQTLAIVTLENAGMQ